MISVVTGVLAATPLEEIAAAELLGVKVMRPLIFLGIGVALVYFGLTGKADRVLRATFGRQS